jgi:hypothetical protein
LSASLRATRCCAVGTPDGSGVDPVRWTPWDWWRLGGTFSWFFNLASKPADLSQDVYAHIRAAANNVINNFNNCGVADGSSYSQADAGTTLRNPNINSSPACTTRDTFNVTGFGAIDPTNVLAVTCRWFIHSQNHPALHLP